MCVNDTSGTHVILYIHAHSTMKWNYFFGFKIESFLFDLENIFIMGNTKNKTNFKCKYQYLKYYFDFNANWFSKNKYYKEIFSFELKNICSTDSKFSNDSIICFGIESCFILFIWIGENSSQIRFYLFYNFSFNFFCVHFWEGIKSKDKQIHKPHRMGIGA